MHLYLLILLCLVAGGTDVAAQAQEPQKTADYVVGPQDLLTILVFDEPQLSGRFRVDNDGSLTYPFIGRVKAGGLTLRAIEADLKRRLGDGYLKNPQITVQVDEFRSQSVFVMGEVRNPGKFALSGNVTLIEALAQAGSVTATAGNEAMILHPKEAKALPTLPDEAPDAQVTRVNLRDLESGKSSENVVIQDGDTIFVPKAERFFVIGQVRNPGSYVLERGMTVLQAVSLAGGVSERGSNRRIRIIRIVNGQKKELDAKPTDPVQAGDTVVVRQRLL